MFISTVEEAEGEGEGDAEEGAADQSKHMKLTNVCTTDPDSYMYTFDLL